MTRNDQESKFEPKEADGSARRPYSAPNLRRLGSVRELTLGSINGKIEGGGTRFPPGQM